MTLRRYILLLFHCTAMLPHQGVGKTVAAILDAGLWWAGLKKDAAAMIAQCLVCSSNKGMPLITGHQRSREYDGPFRYLIIDFVGPIVPASRVGNKHIFTAVCPFSGWYWAIACVEDDSATAARILFMNVICDLAGCPPMLGSDRAPAFVQSVVKCLSEMFGLRQVIGSAYNPQAQSAVERPHREYTMLCKTWLDSLKPKDKTDWDLLVPIFQWSVRTTVKIYNSNFTPYEIITGMKPRTPIEYIATGPDVLRIEQNAYVRQLVEWVRHVHEVVGAEHKRVRENQQQVQYRNLGPGVSLNVGDYCFVRKPPDRDASVRLQEKNFDNIFVVVEKHGEGSFAKAYTLSDLSEDDTI